MNAPKSTGDVGVFVTKWLTEGFETLDLITIGAIIKSFKRTRPSLGVGMTHMSETLQTKRFDTCT